MRSALSLSLLLPIALFAQSAAKPASAAKSAPAAKPAAAPASTPKAAPDAANSGAASAEVKVGTGVENHAAVGAADHFSIAAGTKLWAWAQLDGMAPGTVSVVWKKEGTEVLKTELKVPTPRYRTQAFRTFTKQCAGKWTATFVGADGTELGSAAFTVDITG